MKVKYLVAAALAACFMVSAQAQFKPMKVNGAPVSVERQEALLNNLKARGVVGSDKELQEAARRLAIEESILYQNAIKNKLDKDKTVKAYIEAARRQILVDAEASSQVRKIKVSDADVKKAYDQAKKNYGPKEYQVRHILVKNEEDANKLIKAIQDGSDMGQLATQYSGDNVTRLNRGLTDWLPAGAFDKEIADQLQNAKQGTLFAKAFKTPAGYQIVRFEGARDEQKFPSFDSQKESIRQQLAVQKAKAELDKQVQQAKIQ